MIKALEGIKILDLTRLLPGPFCTQMLGDLGAEIIKVENPVGGDYIRWYPPFGRTESSYFLGLNRNKKSIKLNISSPHGQEIFYRLIKQADVVIEQFKPGTMEKLGLGYQNLSEINPNIIMCSISGYGQDGPFRDMVGHDINFLSTTGILSLNKDSDGKPIIPAIQLADMAGALWAATSILAAIVSRYKTGLGQYIDVSLSDSVLPFAVLMASAYFIDTDSNLLKSNPLAGTFAWYNVYQTKDKRWLAIGMLEYKFWRNFCSIIKREDLIDKQFSIQPRQSQIIQELSDLFSTKTLKEWLEELRDVNMCISEVLDLENALNSNLILERGLIQKTQHPSEGEINFLAFPVKLSNTPAQYTKPPPLFGQHTEEILLDLGYTLSEIKQFKTLDVV